MTRWFTPIVNCDYCCDKRWVTGQASGVSLGFTHSDVLKVKTLLFNLLIMLEVLVDLPNLFLKLL